MTPRPLRVATRRSALALAQTRAFCRDLIAHHPGLTIEEVQIVTAGDRIQDRPLYEVGGKGLFVKEIEEALLEDRADIAVHSMKDLPAHLPPGLRIACVPPRADPRDLLLLRPDLPTLAPSPDPSPPASPLDLLPLNARVGSSSLRRRLTLLDHRPDLQIEPLRGNIDTRLRRLVAGDFDAILLAAAGIARLAPPDLPPAYPLPPALFLPAAAQGILAIEAREADAEVAALLAPLEHAPSRRAATAERAVLAALGADCTVPLAAHLDGEILTAWLWVGGVRRVAAGGVEEGEALGKMLYSSMRIDE